MSKATAKVYGAALYDLAKDEGCETEILQQLLPIREAFLTIPDYRKMLASPGIPKEERHKLIDEAWSGKVNQYLINFMKLLVDKDLISDFTDCGKEYHKLYNVDKGIVQVKVISAIPLDDDQKQKLKEKLSRYLDKKIEIKPIIKPYLKGGLRLDIGGKQFDGSVYSHMEELKKYLEDRKL